MTGIDAAAAIAIGGLVTALVQMAKWSGMGDKYGPLAIAASSLGATVLWVYSKGAYDRSLLFDFAAGWANIMLTSAGIFGFTRSLPAAVSEGSRNSVIPGAGQNVTEKPPTPPLDVNPKL